MYDEPGERVPGAAPILGRVARVHEFYVGDFAARDGHAHADGRVLAVAPGGVGVDAVCVAAGGREGVDGVVGLIGGAAGRRGGGNSLGKPARCLDQCVFDGHEQAF